MVVRVLMVDESAEVRNVLRRHLECIGCEVVAEAGNTAQALDLFHTVAPSLVTLDIAVSRGDGLSALAPFRTMRAAHPMTPILIVSEPAFPEIRRVFLSEGALDYILKPIDDGSFERLFARLCASFPHLRQMAPEAVRKAPLAVPGDARPMRERRGSQAA
jgi:CheY-like chemotaxis protein